MDKGLVQDIDMPRQTKIRPQAVNGPYTTPTNEGFMSSADFNTFNSKTSISQVEAATGQAYNQAVSYTNSATGNLQHNSLQGEQGGDSNNRYHLSSLEYNQVRSAATGAVTGMLSPADWTTFNAKTSIAQVQAATGIAYSNSVSYTNSATGNLQHNEVKSIQGGDASNRYHLAALEYNQVRSTATSSTTGMLSPADWQTFNNKTSIAQVQAATGVAYSNATAYADTQDKVFPADINRFGFLNPLTTTTLLFNGVDTITLSCTGAYYYRSGLKYAITTKTKQVASPMVDGTLYFIFIDATDGTLSSSTSSWTLNDTKVPVATLFWNSTLTPKFLLSDERHSCGIDRAWHREHHFSEGTEFAGGSTVFGTTLNNTADSSKTFGVSSGTIVDEDMFITVSALPKPNGTTLSYYNLYRTSPTNYVWAASDMPFKYSGAAAPYGYIEYDNGSGVSTASANNRFVNTYLFLCNVISPSGEPIQGTSTADLRYLVVQGRGSYTTAALAYGESFSTFDITGFPTAEGLSIYQFTWDTSGVANSVKGRVVLNRVQRVLSNIISSTTAQIAAHNSLSGLQGGAINEYYHLDANQYIIATTAATSGASGFLTSQDWNTFNNKTSIAQVQAATGQSYAEGVTYTNSATAEAYRESVAYTNSATGFLGYRESMIVALSDETTAVTTGTGKVTFHMPYAFKLQKVKAGLSTASTSGSATFDLKHNGTSVFSTQVSVDANSRFSDSASVPSVLAASPVAIASGEVMTADVITAGTGATGAKLYLIGYSDGVV